MATAHKRTPALSLRNIRVSIEGTEVVQGLDLDLYPGEVHALMGPNGSGKSTLACALMGHPSYDLTGEAALNGKSINELRAHERAQSGLFLSFQHPVAVPGVTVGHFLKSILVRKFGTMPVRTQTKRLREEFESLSIPWSFTGRYLNDGFSGGEKKRLEILQMNLLEPSVAILDEPDSGLDIDALRIVAEGINRAAQRSCAVLLVTHYQRILNHVVPTRVHIFKDGRILSSGGPDKALKVEQHGYEEADRLMERSAS